MRYFILGDEETVLGFGLAGVKGQAIKTNEEADSYFSQALADRSIGILIITERIAAFIRERVNETRLKRPHPVIVEIPDRLGHLEGRKTLLDLIREAIGVKL